MDALKRTMPLVVALMMLLCIVPVSAGNIDGAGEANGVLIYEFAPYHEGVSLKNYGNTAVDLKGYVISDSEGEWEFIKSYSLMPGGVVTVVADLEDAEDFANRYATFYVGDGTIEKNGNLALGNNGDDIYLFNGEELLDAVCYGDKTIADDSIWLGESAPTKKGRWDVRTGTFDTDTAEDWFIHIPGWTDNKFDPETFYDATVTPFLFPDHGGVPIFQALETAQDTVFINIYFLGSKNMYGLLCDLEERGVDVVLLHERNPLGIPLEEGYTSYMKQLIDSGGEIYFIGGADENRYRFDHAKYCIIDGETTIVMSENWTDKNLNGTVHDNYVGTKNFGNRGWGAVIESTQYASVMKSVFDNDMDQQYGDVVAFDKIYTNVTASNLYYESPEGHTFTSYEAKVAPMLSPDNSYDTVMYYIENATSRVFSEQQDLGSSYAPWNESPLTAMKDKAHQGLDVRFILGDAEKEAENLIGTINQQSLIKAAVMSSPYVHNKGIIADDVSIVNSVNWTSNSFDNNREAGVVIKSDSIADYFAESFMDDFNKNYTYEGISVDISMEEVLYVGEETTVSVSTSVSGEYIYEWDYGDGNMKTTEIPRIVFSPTLGSHVMTVKVYEENVKIGEAKITYTVLEPGQEPGDTPDVEPEDPGDDPSVEPGDTPPVNPDPPSGSSIDFEKILNDLGYGIYPIIIIIIGVIIAVVKRLM